MNLAWTSSPMMLVIAALTAYRLTRLWVDDMVPPLPWLRRQILDYAYRDSVASGERYERFNRTIERYGQPPLEYLVSCYWCAGFWISLAVALASSLIPSTVWALLALPFALSAVVGLLGTRD